MDLREQDQEIQELLERGLSPRTASLLMIQKLPTLAKAEPNLLAAHKLLRTGQTAPCWLAPSKVEDLRQPAMVVAVVVDFLVVLPVDIRNQTLWLEAEVDPAMQLRVFQMQR